MPFDRTMPAQTSTAFAMLLSLVVSMTLGALPREAQAQHESGHQCRHHAEEQSGGEQIAAFEVQAIREVPNDWATARLSVQSEGKQPSEVAEEVNAAMKTALQRAKRARGVRVRTGGYSTYPVYDEGRVVRWRASQEIVVESGDTDAFSALLGQLQSESVTLTTVEFGVQRETRRKIEDELISEALAGFRARAGLVAAGLGASEWALEDVSISTSGSAPPPVLRQSRSKFASAASTAPSFEGGASEIRVSASGSIRLAPSAD